MSDFGERAAGGGVSGLLRRFNGALQRIPYALVALAARVFPAAVFWQSGQTKVDGFSISDSTYYLFANEYKVPVIPPDVAAYLATIAEHVFPVLLIVGLATRFSAFSLLIMTLVIEIFVYPTAWVTHGLWATAFLLLMARGPGALSLDHWLGLDQGRG